MCVYVCTYLYIIYKRAIEWEREQEQERERERARVKSESKSREYGVRLGKTATPIRVGGYTPAMNSLGMSFGLGSGSGPRPGFGFWGFAQLLGVGVCRATRRQPTEFESSATTTATTTTITTTANRSDHNKVDRAALSLKAGHMIWKKLCFCLYYFTLGCLCVKLRRGRTVPTQLHIHPEHSYINII